MRGFYGFFYPRCRFLWIVLPLDANGNHVVQKCMETAESNASPHMVALLLRIQARVQTSFSITVRFFTITARVLLVYCSVLFDYCSIIVRLLFDYPTVWLLFDYCSTTVRLLFDYCSITVWLLFDYCSIFVRLGIGRLLFDWNMVGMWRS